MPLVNVYYCERTHNASTVVMLEDNLAAIVANRLNVEDVPSISPGDVTVVSHVFGSHDVSEHDMVIVVTAHSYPERIKEHKAIAEGIASDIAPTLRKYNFGIIVNLTPLEWAVREPKN